MGSHDHTTIPPWTWISPVAAAGLLTLTFSKLLSDEAALTVALAVLLLGATIFAAVHHAEVLALRLGEPFGSILLAVAVTVIEVALIVSIILSGAEGGDAVARDTVYAAVMIVLNGVVGLCLVMGGQRHIVQSFQLQGASAALGVLGTLAVLALILPNFTVTTQGPSYSDLQVVVVGVLSLILWGFFVFAQTMRHRDYFVDVEVGQQLTTTDTETPSDHVALASLGLLLLSLIAVVMLAKLLSHTLDEVINAAGLPHSFLGVIIASIVLLPESLAAVKSAVRNRLQNSLNLALGSAIASIGLTIPTVAAVAVAIDMRIALGLSSANMMLLTLTLFVSTLTLGTGRTTVLQGVNHLVIFAVFLLLSAVP